MSEQREEQFFDFAAEDGICHDERYGMNIAHREWTEEMFPGAQQTPGTAA